MNKYLHTVASVGIFYSHSIMMHGTTGLKKKLESHSQLEPSLQENLQLLSDARFLCNECVSADHHFYCNTICF